MRVLLVDDMAADAHLVSLAFAEADAAVSITHAIDGQDAMTRLRGILGERSELPHLILLDLNMPRMDGREFLRAVKDDAALRALPVVVLTTSDANADIAAAYRLGAAGYIVKPMDIDDLTAHLATLVRYWGEVVRLPTS